MTINLPILGQDALAIESQLTAFFGLLLTPAGIALAILGMVALAAALLSGRAAAWLTAVSMFLLVFMLRESDILSKPLWAPFQFTRTISRPAAFAIIGIAAAQSLIAALSARSVSIGAASWLFFAFQIYYGLNLMFFVEPLKGSLALVSMTFSMLAAGVGMRGLMQDAQSANRALEVFVWAAGLACAAIVIQLAVGPSSALVGSRLAGICGNPNQCGGACALLLLPNLYVFAQARVGSAWKWLSFGTVALLALFVMWSGSRTAALAGVLGCLAMYRGRLGRLLVAGAALVVGVLLAAFILQGADESGTGMFQVLRREGADTRTEVWTFALSQWAGSPIFGIMPDGIESGVESTPLRAMASLGTIGLALVLLVAGASIVSMVRVHQASSSNPELAPLGDLYLGCVTALLVINLLEGVAFGVLTFYVLYMYAVLGLGSFICDAQTRQGFELTTDAVSSP